MALQHLKSAQRTMPVTKQMKLCPKLVNVAKISWKLPKTTWKGNGMLILMSVSISPLPSQAQEGIILRRLTKSLLSFQHPGPLLQVKTLFKPGMTSPRLGYYWEMSLTAKCHHCPFSMMTLLAIIFPLHRNISTHSEGSLVKYDTKSWCCRREVIFQYTPLKYRIFECKAKSI